ncbi:MAG: efflux RND transporter periplasmic adaptor subunit, partial [bacterium]|nr:efflux RND transporter periplasmic adaptor subunit [bacterium]
AGAASSEEPDHTPHGVRPGSHEDWCVGHGVPESKCTRCNPELIAAFEEAGDWCDEHGLPESQCLICHPDLVIARPAAAAAPVADWCMGHGLPESKCTKCNQSLIAEFKANGDWCEAHGFPESVCPLCNPQQPPAGAKEAAIEARTVRLDSPDLERSAGIQTELVEQHRGTASIECAARIAFDADRIAHVRAVVPGIVRRVRVERGATVKRGAPLFELESTRVGETQGALQSAREHVRTARANLERKRELEAGGAVSVRAVELAKQELASARAEASAAGATLRMTGAARSAPSGRYTLTAPIGGTIVRRPAVVGLIATETESLATIADTSVMWVLCEVPEAHTSKISLGQRINVTVQGSEDADIEGEIKWIAAEVDPRTRTVTARAEVPNPSSHLRANQFATARIEIGSPRSTTSVPRSAVQRIGDLEVVFIRTAEGVYRPRVVQRHGDGERVQVAGRLQPGESVVTTGAVLLRTEIMPGSIGAGCCEAVQQKGD